MKCIIKRILILPLVLLANTVFGGSMGAVERDAYDGVYVGADIGVIDLIDKESTLNPSIAHSMSATGITGGLLAGYDYTIVDRIKLGFEGVVNANGVSASDLALYAPVSSYRINSSYDVGFRFLPGYEINPGTVGHILLGYSNARFHIQDSGDYGFINQTMNKSGFQCGLGAKTLITDHLSLRADALYTQYSNSSNIGASNNSNYFTQVYKNNFAFLEGDLTLIYKFN